MDWFLFAVGILAAFAALLFAIGITLWVYFRLSAKHPAHKLGIEIGLAFFVAIVSLIIRLAVVIYAMKNAGAGETVEEPSLGSGMGVFIKNLFYSIAGLTFNGDFDKVTNGVLACLYYGVIVYAGLVFLIAISAGVSYSVYSYIQMVRLVRGRNAVYYVFTAVNKESIVLAKSIKEHHESDNKNSKRKVRCTIIFFDSGENSFSRKDPLHRELIENGFYYFSDSRRTDKKKYRYKTLCFLRWFKFGKRHFKRPERGEYKNKAFHVFAVDSGTDYENTNSTLIFDDIRSAIDTYINFEGRTLNDELPTVVNYYLLTGGEINFESYEREKQHILDKCFESHASSFKVKAAEYAAEYRDGLYKNLFTKEGEKRLKSEGEFLEGLSVVNFTVEEKQKLIDAKDKIIKNAEILVPMSYEFEHGKSDDTEGLKKLREEYKNLNEEFKTSVKESVKKYFKNENEEKEIADKIISLMSAEVDAHKVIKEIELCGLQIGEELAVADFENRKKNVGNRFQLNVFNEATLSSYDLLCARNKHLNKLGDCAFDKDSREDENGAYRIAVIGFGKTGQYAMEELYVHTAHLKEPITKPASEESQGDDFTAVENVPTQFIADVFDKDIEDKSGIFAYNHPLFRCFCSPEDEPSILSATDIVDKAEKVDSDAFNVICQQYKDKCNQDNENKRKQGNNVKDCTEADARIFVNTSMAFPIVHMHESKCFGYPFVDKNSTEAFVQTAKNSNMRAIVIALGNDESNIEMANIIIDSYRRSFLKEYMSKDKEATPAEAAKKGYHVTIYVNLVESNSKLRLNWREDIDGKEYTHKYELNGKDIVDYPRLSVITFGSRESMYSYGTLVEDYSERLYNYGYDSHNDNDAATNKYENFIKNLLDNFDFYKSGKEGEEAATSWAKLPQFKRLSNKSAQLFAINYRKMTKYESWLKDFKDGKIVNNEMWGDPKFIRLEHLEHERWDRFYISHGWVYAPYYKYADFSGVSSVTGKRIKDKEKEERRAVKQHDCLCPFEKVLDEDTKRYDRGNIELAFIDKIAYAAISPFAGIAQNRLKVKSEYKNAIADKNHSELKSFKVLTFLKCEKKKGKRKQLNNR